MVYAPGNPSLAAAIEAIRAEERERCAKIAESRAIRERDAGAAALLDFAAVIRTLK